MEIRFAKQISAIRVLHFKSGFTTVANFVLYIPNLQRFPEPLELYGAGVKRFGELVQLNNLKREIVDELFFDLVEFLPTPSLVEVTKDKLKGYIIKICGLPVVLFSFQFIKGKFIMKKILITGSAGFIGSNLVSELLRSDEVYHIIGLDNMNDYYDVSLKQYRLEQIEQQLIHSKSKWTFIEGDLADKDLVTSIFEDYRPNIVVNLAAQAGVRYSITNPDVYIESNIIGFQNILEACRHYPVEHLVYASSSSVYGGNEKVPFSTDDKVDNPVSLYAATKKSNELFAHAYSKLYDIPTTGLRFFTVYGPAGRPDMAYFGFTNKLLKGETIEIFNYGNCKRDFTYVDDIVEGVKRVMFGAPQKRSGSDGLPIPPYAIYNIGNSNPENLLDFVHILSEELVLAGVLPADFDIEAHKKLVPMQAGDVPVTYADTSDLERDFGFSPSTTLREGLRQFAQWYKEYYK